MLNAQLTKSSKMHRDFESLAIVFTFVGKTQRSMIGILVNSKFIDNFLIYLVVKTCDNLISPE